MAKRIYCNITDFDNKEFSILRQIGFKTTTGGVVVYHDIKIGLDQLDIIKENIELLSSWVNIKNSMNIGDMDHTNKYQVLVWCKLIKRDNKQVSLKTLIGVFKALINIQNNPEYRTKYIGLYNSRLSSLGLSEDWLDRLMRSVNK